MRRSTELYVAQLDQRINSHRITSKMMRSGPEGDRDTPAVRRLCQRYADLSDDIMHKLRELRDIVIDIDKEMS